MPEDSTPPPKPENTDQKLHALLKSLIFGMAVETDPVLDIPVLDSMAYFWTKTIQEHHKMLKHQQELVQKLQRDTLKLRKEYANLSFSLLFLNTLIQLGQAKLNHSDSLNQREAMIMIRAHNSRLSKWEHIKFPPEISVNNPPLPLTREKLLQMNSRSITCHSRTNTYDT